MGNQVNLLQRIWAYFRENPGTFLLGIFETALGATIVIVLSGNLGLANSIGTFAFYPLLGGILVQLVVTLLAVRKKSRIDKHC